MSKIMEIVTGLIAKINTFGPDDLFDIQMKGPEDKEDLD